MAAWTYTDKTGENIVLLAETEVMEWGETADGVTLSNKDVYAHRFLKVDGQWEEVWRVYDMETPPAYLSITQKTFGKNIFRENRKRPPLLLPSELSISKKLNCMLQFIETNNLKRVEKGWFPKKKKE